MTDEAMPRTNAPNMTEIKFSVPTALLRQVERIADIEETKISEMHRHCWVQGVAAVSEQCNKRLINKKLVAKGAIIDILDSIPAEKLEEAIALLKGLEK